MRILVLFLLLGLCLSGFAQNYSVSGKVIDSESKEPLAFVNIVVNNGKYGGATDIDGKFLLYSPKQITSLKFSYVGYEALNIPITTSDQSLLIRLKSISYDLSEVVIIPGENPADRIIKKTIENRDLNDPEKINSFSYTSYDKMIFTADMDSMESLNLFIDSFDIKLKSFVDEQHLFLMETVAKRKFLAPDKSYQKVIASRVSGFKDPLFVFLISQMQSFSFYKPMITIFDKNYINPIGKGSLNKYFFLLEDTTYYNKDTVFIISFRPGKNKNFDGLKGLLYINTHGFAIQNVIAEPTVDESDIGIKIQQMYELIDGEKWFPVQLNTDLTFNNNTANSYKFIGQGKSYLRDIVLNEEFVKREFNNIEIDVDPDAVFRNEDYWNKYRTDSLDQMEIKTYHVIDSIGKKYKFDKLAKSFDALLTGKIPWGVIDLDIDKFLRYNDHEGIYLGFGLHTNDRISQFFKIGGYWGYGFCDKTAKYGGDLQLLLYKNSDVNLKFSYINDVSESGSVSYFDRSENLLSNESLRDFLIQRMDRTMIKKVDVGFRAFNYLKINIGFSQSRKNPTYDYYFGNTDDNVTIGVNEFNFTELNLGFRYAYNEKFIRNTRKKISLGTHYPVIHFQYSRGFDNILDGEYSYDRFDVRITKSVYIKYIGRSSFLLNSGYINGNIPATDLYNGHGSYRNFTILAPFSFATMRMNEFLVSKYVSLYYQHNFGNLLFKTRIFNPEIAIAANAGFGWLDHPQSHYEIDVQSFERGYYEAGLLLNKIIDFGFYNYGVGVFYRLGTYSFEETNRNIAWKISFLLPI
ncbi:MAG: DUF5686 and carboxypeptidase regulatory-like domain-containing protein [Bacteroidales bacterium]|nr:DUF5686 and carboxypeptidase regulatory-like domain-containing protein [Bacteroidales bacterium]